MKASPSADLSESSTIAVEEYFINDNSRLQENDDKRIEEILLKQRK
jgi:hypothetical protein